MATKTTIIFSDDELTSLIGSFLDGSGQPQPESEIVAFVEWAARVRTEAYLVDMCIEGSLKASRAIDGEDFQFELAAKSESQQQ